MKTLLHSATLGAAAVALIAPCAQADELSDKALAQLKDSLLLIIEAADVCDQVLKQQITSEVAVPQLTEIGARIKRLEAEMELHRQECIASGREVPTEAELQAFFTGPEGTEIANKLTPSLQILVATMQGPDAAMRSAVENIMGGMMQQAPQ